MSTEKEAEKHTYLFASKEELSKPSSVKLPEPEKPPGLILEDGSINWDCPCLGGMVAGPCGVQFREAFSCFHYSEAEPKGSDCMEAFSKMQECMHKYPTLYGNDKDEDVFGVEESESKSDKSKIERNDHKPVNNGEDKSTIDDSNKLKKLSS